MSVIPVGHPIHNQENTSETLNLFHFIKFCLRLCWLVSLALETISGTNTIGWYSTADVADVLGPVIGSHYFFRITGDFNVS